MENGRRQPSRDGTSRMMREYQVRICERLGVRFPGPTRHWRRFWRVRAMSAYPLIATDERTSRGSGSCQEETHATQQKSIFIRSPRRPGPSVCSELQGPELWLSRCWSPIRSLLIEWPVAQPASLLAGYARDRDPNVATGRSVIVRVNDRGPFIPGRIVDVSYSADTTLGMVAVGIAKVKLEVLE